MLKENENEVDTENNPNTFNVGDFVLHDNRAWYISNIIQSECICIRYDDRFFWKKIDINDLIYIPFIPDTQVFVAGKGENNKLFILSYYNDYYIFKEEVEHVAGDLFHIVKHVHRRDVYSFIDEKNVKYHKIDITRRSDGVLPKNLTNCTIENEPEFNGISVSYEAKCNRINMFNNIKFLKFKQNELFYLFSLNFCNQLDLAYQLYNFINGNKIISFKIGDFLNNKVNKESMYISLIYGENIRFRTCQKEEQKNYLNFIKNHKNYTFIPAIKNTKVFCIDNNNEEIDEECFVLGYNDGYYIINVNGEKKIFSVNKVFNTILNPDVKYILKQKLVNCQIIKSTYEKVNKDNQGYINYEIKKPNNKTRVVYLTNLYSKNFCDVLNKSWELFDNIQTSKSGIDTQNNLKLGIGVLNKNISDENFDFDLHESPRSSEANNPLHNLSNPVKSQEQPVLPGSPGSAKSSGQQGSVESSGQPVLPVSTEEKLFNIKVDVLDRFLNLGDGFYTYYENIKSTQPVDLAFEIMGKLFDEFKI